MYIRKYGSQEIYSAVGDMVERVRQQLQSSLINDVKWMDSITKQRALDKLKAITVIVGSPNELLDKNELNRIYDGFEVDCSDRFFEASIELMTFKQLQVLRKLRNPMELTYDWTIMAEASSVGPQFHYSRNVMS